MKRQPLTSTVIASVGYDIDTAVLEIEFASGELWHYNLVPPSVHRALLDADSPGRYFGTRVRDRYPERQIYD